MISCKLFISVKIPLDFGNINCTIFNLLFSYPNTKKDCTVLYYNNESSVQSLICELFTLLQHFTNKLHLDVLCKIKVQRVWFLMKDCNVKYSCLLCSPQLQSYASKCLLFFFFYCFCCYWWTWCYCYCCHSYLKQTTYSRCVCDPFHPSELHCSILCNLWILVLHTLRDN